MRAKWFLAGPSVAFIAAALLIILYDSGR